MDNMKPKLITKQAVVIDAMNRITERIAHLFNPIRSVENKSDYAPLAR